jgi:hypothetical protein
MNEEMDTTEDMDIDEPDGYYSQFHYLYFI